MSSGPDDIVFEEVSYRQPRRLRRPDRDLEFACLAYGSPSPEDLAVFLDRRTADRIERHALSDTSVELGGILLGQECVDEETGRPFVWVHEAIEAKHYENTQASFTYTHDSWGEITRERDAKHPDLDIVGWYHTHPDYGIFLSGHDQFIQQHFFAQPLQVAYVVDPIRQTRGFFQWREGRLPQLEGYYVVSPRAERLDLARTVNDLEGVPNAEGGGLGGLSPRLEAELIAMIQRPQTVVAGGDRGQGAAVFSLLGMVLGGLGVALALWIVTLNTQLRQQSASLAAMKAGLAGQAAEDEDRDALERAAAKEAALDALLREVRVGDPPERIVDAYTRLQLRFDEAVAERAVYEQIAEDLAEQRSELERLERVRVAQQKALTEAEAELKAADRLKAENERLAKRAREADDLEEELALKESIEVGALPRKYRIAWYAAVAGWTACVLVALGSVAVLARRLPTDEEAVVPTPSPAPPAGRTPEGPHRIG